MGCTIRVTTSDCFYNNWRMCRGVYWGTDGVSTRTGKAGIVMSLHGGTCASSGERKLISIGGKTSFGNGLYIAKLLNVGEGYATIEVWRTSELTPSPPIDDKPPAEDPEPTTTDPTRPQFLSYKVDKLGFKVGDILKTECVIINRGLPGTLYLKVGLGYIDSSNMIYLTGMPVSDQIFRGYQQFQVFRNDVKVDITDYYRQRGIGWAYLQQQMYLFFLGGHRDLTTGDIIWDVEKHIKVYIDEPEGFKDPTDLDESIIGDIVDTVEDAIPAFGGLGGLGGIYDKIKPDTKDVIEWVLDTLTPEPKEEKEPPDMMPFIYIGFAGLIGYLLIRSQ